MLSDALAHAHLYERLHPRFKPAFDFLRGNDLHRLPLGRIDLSPGDDLFALVQDNLTKPAEKCRWEAHRTYIDIQHIVAGGVEAMAAAPIELFRVESPYDPAKDVAFFHTLPPGTPTTFTQVAPAHFAIFFPHDVHMPLLQHDAPALVRKIVIKVRA